MDSTRYLLQAETRSEFIKKTSEIITSKNGDWEIWKGSLKQRGLFSSNTSQVRELRKRFKIEYEWNNIPNSSAVIYLDTLTFMKRLLENYLNFEDIHILMECQIPFARKKRIDYLVCFKNTILILEFNYFEESKDTEECESQQDRFNSKLFQVMQYDTLLKTVLPNHIKTVPYVIFYSAEKDKSNEIEENISNNKTELETLAELIKTLYNKDINASNVIKELFQK